jgi:chlorite dismutase
MSETTENAAQNGAQREGSGAPVGRPYGTGRVPLPQIDRSDQEEIAKGQFVQYAFYKLDPAWRLLPAEEREQHKAEFIATVARFADEVDVRSYSLMGLRADADFLLWNVASSLDAFQRLGTAIFSTTLGAYLRQPYSYLAITKRSIYTSRRSASISPGARLRMKPAGAKYLFVYPFVKTRAWYKLTFSARQGMMDEHIRIGHKYPSVRLNTTYSFGLDDQEFVVAFETDEPRDFVDLVQELRETEASMYTLRDTPIFSCIALSLPETLDALGGVGAAQPLAAADRA